LPNYVTIKNETGWALLAGWANEMLIGVRKEPIMLALFNFNIHTVGAVIQLAPVHYSLWVGLVEDLDETADTLALITKGHEPREAKAWTDDMWRLSNGWPGVGDAEHQAHDETPAASQPHPPATPEKSAKAKPIRLTPKARAEHEAAKLRDKFDAAETKKQVQAEARTAKAKAGTKADNSRPQVRLGLQVPAAA
jgi:hypothetical protein